MAGGAAPAPDVLDGATVASLLATAGIVLAAHAASRLALTAATTPRALRFLFTWHLADAACHLVLEGSFLYHCFFSWLGAGEAADAAGLFPTPYNFLGHEDRRIYGPQAGGASPLAQLWMVYARADRRWAGADLGVISLELLTVFFDGPLACYVCYLIAKRDPRASFWMVVLATCELYGGFMTTGNLNLDGSNFMYMWVYLVFFNMLWVFIPLYAMWYSFNDISSAFAARAAKKSV